MKKLTALTLIALLCLTLFAACAQLDTESAPPLAKGDKLIVGLELGVEIVFQPISWAAKGIELDAGRIDCIWNGMATTPDRKESMNLSKPYVNNTTVILTTPNAVVNSLEDLANYKIGVQQKSSSLEMLMTDPMITDAAKANVIEYVSYDECIRDMQSGSTQVMIVGEVHGLYMNEQMGDAFNVAPVDFGESYLVIGFRKGDIDLCQQVEGALQKVIDSGKGAEISNKWFGRDIMLNLE